MTQTRWISLIVLILGLGAVTAYWWTGSASKEMPKSELVQEADPQQILAHVRSLNSPVTLVNFWASWCEPCKVEFPHIVNVKKEFEGKGLRVVFISVDDPSDLASAEEFLKAQKIGPPTFYKGKQSLSFVSQIFPKWSGAVPATVLLGPELQVLDGWEGDTSLEEFQKRIGKHLKGT